VGGGGFGRKIIQGRENMLKPKWICLLLGICFFSYGCDFLLSQDEVKRSIFAVMRGYETSTEKVKPQVEKRYGNGADLRFVSMNETLVTEMRILLKDDKRLTASGTCFFSGYEDPYTDYSVDGELTFDCERSGNEEAVCDFSCNTVLSGGKVEKLVFLLNIDSQGRCSAADVMANGKKIRFNQWAFVGRIVQAFTSGLTGG
jgi:hypothetical protein